jgi:lipopolysaccharide export system protein LptA
MTAIGRSPARTLAFGLMAVFVWSHTAVAQSLNFGDGASDLPIEVVADDGIEWERDGQQFLARGNARATRGEVSVHADLLRAYYRKNESGGTGISRLDAVGSVRIVSAGETAYGDTGVYDVDQSILVLSGKKVRLVTAEDEITADQQLEYYDLKRMAVARGNAVARRENRTLMTDVLVAHFKRDTTGKSRIHRVEAFDNVHIVTDLDEVWGDRGVYNVDTGIATLTGAVRIVRGENTLAGCSAEVNLNTGLSKLKSCKGSGQRVRGLLKPSDQSGVKEK